MGRIHLLKALPLCMHGCTEVESALLRAENIKGGFYLYEYTVQPPRQPKRHLQTIFALIPGEVSRRNLPR